MHSGRRTEGAERDWRSEKISGFPCVRVRADGGGECVSVVGAGYDEQPKNVVVALRFVGNFCWCSRFIPCFNRMSLCLLDELP